MLLSQKVGSYRREDVHENYFLIQHGRSMPRSGWKVKHVASLSDPLFVTNRKEHPAAFDQCHLFVRMVVRGSYDLRLKVQAADHQASPDDHLSFDARLQLFDRNAAPIRVLWL